MALPTNLLIHTTQIERKSTSGVRNTVGKLVESYTTITASAACLIQPIKERLEITKVGKKEIATHYGYYQITEDILVDDIVTFNSKKYVVISVQDEAGQANHYRVLLKTGER